MFITDLLANYWMTITYQNHEKRNDVSWPHPLGYDHLPGFFYGNDQEEF